MTRFFSFFLSSFPPFLSSLPFPISFYYGFFFFLFPIYASLLILLFTRPIFLLNSSSSFVICHLSSVTTYHLSSIICLLSSVITTLNLPRHDVLQPTHYIYLFSHTILNLKSLPLFFSNHYLMPLSQNPTSYIFISTISRSPFFISYS